MSYSEFCCNCVCGNSDNFMCSNSDDFNTCVYASHFDFGYGYGCDKSEPECNEYLDDNSSPSYGEFDCCFVNKVCHI